MFFPNWHAPVASLAFIVLSGCTTFPEQRVAQPAASYQRTPSAQAPGIGALVAEFAVHQLGVPYLYGGASPNGFDCSGLVQYVYRQAGLEVPRNSRAQYRTARAIRLEDAAPGDLLFFRSRRLSHVGIYLGNDHFVHAPASGKHVTIASLADEFYRARFAGARRFESP